MPPDGDARLAQALHGLQEHHHARPLGAVGGAAGAALAAARAGGEGGALARPLAGQGADDAGLDARLLGRPLGRLGHAVRLAQDVGLELVEADGAVGDVVLVVGVLGDPHVGDGHGQRRVRAHARRDPLGVVEDRVGVVVERVDEDGLDALLLEPHAPDRRLLARVRAARGVGVVGPEDDHLGVAAARPAACRTARACPGASRSRRCGWRPSATPPSCPGCRRRGWPRGSS